MKPVRFFADQQTIWYNLADYIQLLLDTQTIHPVRPASLYKRKGPSKSLYQILLDKVNRLSPVYKRKRDGLIYIDWVVFEHLYRFVRPFLVRPDDWMNTDTLFRQLQLAIERPKRLHQAFHSEIVTEYFIDLNAKDLLDKLPPEP